MIRGIFPSLPQQCRTVLALASAVGLACHVSPLETQLESLIAGSGAETVGVYYKSLGTGDSLFINADIRMHAASMMKVPVMIRLYAMAASGRLAIDDSVTVTNTFHSIVDGSPYELTAQDDSDARLYERVDDRVGVRELIDRMITLSSNLATNMLIELANARQTTLTMRALGADSIQVLRGVEDIKAFELGLNNTTTARDLGVIFSAIAEHRAGTPAACDDMIAVLSRQSFAEGIPAGVPAGTTVAHKTGSITAIRHDGGIVYPAKGNPYVLVVLTRGIAEPERADSLIAEISRRVYAHNARDN